MRFRKVVYLHGLRNTGEIFFFFFYSIQLHASNIYLGFRETFIYRRDESFSHLFIKIPFKSHIFFFFNV